MPYVVGDECILCLACVAGCASGAIREGDTKCSIDPDLCVECGTCAEHCPSGAITFADGGELTTEEVEAQREAGYLRATGEA
jgi:ferredoxin